jgi:hypothetical protein
MNVKKRVENRIQGWLPKDTVRAYLQKPSRPVWRKPFWISTVIVTIVAALLFLFALHMPLQQVTIGLALASVCIGIAYYIRVKPSISVNRALYTLLGITPLGFALSVAYAVFLGSYVTGGLWGGLTS